ncbi:apoptosis regulator Bcl-2 [Astyanax mexicanus]|uniref:Apoptosis regulator Bcl-2 n=1 Tax=Astyanax mexicanus TaxID=7994 RepID=A0A8B9GQH9_ASTMX|nr:apoptosis regulator Bcl-2 [Astyanax mexicanus]KAG9273651.1 apoptosis regulator Bcl-2 [Astyanax mexicanus]
MASKNDMVVYDSRGIVENYLHHKLAKSGHAWELHEQDDDDGEEEEEEEEEEEDEEEEGKRVHPAPPAVHGALREAGDELERLYRSDLTDMTGRLELEPAGARRSFAAVADELFRDGVNWGRIVAFLEFGAAVCVERKRTAAEGITADVARWMTEYLNGPVLRGWIRENGGWDAFVDLYGRQKDSVFGSSWPSIVTVFSLAALGAVGFTIGAYLAQK